MNKSVRVVIGEDSEVQESSFMNGTLQSAPNALAFTIQTFLTVPDVVAQKGEQHTAKYIEEMLARAAAAVPDLTFDVQIGPDLSAQPAPKKRVSPS